MRDRLGIIVLVLTTLVVGCSAPSQTQSSTTAPSAQQPAQQNRTLVLAHRYEFSSLAPKALQSNGPLSTTRLFNAALTQVDDKGNTHNYLAESLPQLNTDSWRVFPDGRMETTYVLKPGLTWQDGAPLTASDYAFAFRLYKDTSLGAFVATPQDTMESVQAPDPRTLTIVWRSLNSGAGTLTFEEFDALPAHLLEAAYADYTEGRSSREIFMGLPYWSTEYIGAGPYRLERWEPAVQLEGTAFDGHVLGRPKINRVVVKLFVDENQTLATILAGGVLDHTCCNTLRFAQLVTLKNQWEAAGKGTAVGSLSTAVFLFLQMRPDVVGHPALLDVRVRRALAHSIDRDALNEGLFDGLGAPTDTPVPPTAPFYPEVQRLMTHYPYDPNRSAQLMGEAGFTKDSGGFFADQQGKRFFVDFAVQSASEIERMQSIVADTWRRSGFDVHTVVIAPQLFTQQETRHNLPGLGYSFFTTGEPTFRSAEIGTADNRWTGSNRSAWINPEYDRLYEAASGTLDLTERGKYVAQMMALISENLPGYTLYFSQAVKTWVSQLQGPSPLDAAGFGRSVKTTTWYWDIQDWTFNS